MHRFVVNVTLVVASVPLRRLEEQQLQLRLSRATWPGTIPKRHWFAFKRSILYRGFPPLSRRLIFDQIAAGYLSSGRRAVDESTKRFVWIEKRKKKQKLTKLSLVCCQKKKKEKEPIEKRFTELEQRRAGETAARKKTNFPRARRVTRETRGTRGSSGTGGKYNQHAADNS